jgi:hypothetical protein
MAAMTWKMTIEMDIIPDAGIYQGDLQQHQENAPGKQPTAAGSGVIAANGGQEFPVLR